MFVAKRTWLLKNKRKAELPEVSETVLFLLFNVSIIASFTQSFTQITEQNENILNKKN